MRDNRISLNTPRARRPYRRLRPRAIASKFKRSGLLSIERPERGVGQTGSSRRWLGVSPVQETTQERRRVGTYTIDSIRIVVIVTTSHAKGEIYVDLLSRGEEHPPFISREVREAAVPPLILFFF